MADESEAAALLRRHHRSARILLAEDNEVNREVAQALLQSVGLSADMAADGLQALQKARAARYDVVLMDMQMPVMNGLEAARAIRALPGWQATPILALTANAFNEDRLACIEAGMTDFVAKPMVVAAFYAALLRALIRPEDLPTRGASTVDMGRSAMADGPAKATLARLSDVSGHDSAPCLQTLSGDIEKYVRLLQIFVDGHAQDMAKLADSVAAGDQSGARSLTHTLLGVAATVGANDIASAARLLDNALRADPGGLRLLPELACEMQSIRDGFETLAAVLKG